MLRRADVHFEVRGLRIDCQYNPSFVSWLKAEIPPTYRTYSPQMGWMILATQHDNVFAKLVYDNIQKFFHTFEHDERGFRDKASGWDQWRRVQEEQARAKRGNANDYANYHARQQQRDRDAEYQREYNRQQRANSQGGGSYQAPPPRFTESSKYAQAFETLGVHPTSSKAEIKVAHRRLAIKWHPDKNQDNIEEATQKMQQINAAYDLLK